MTKKGIIQIAILIAVIIVVATWFIVEEIGRVDGEPLTMIPSNAAIVIEVDNPKSVYHKLEEDNSLWKKLLLVNNIKALKNNLVLLDTLLESNAEYRDLLWNSSLTIALYSDSITGLETLLLSKVGVNPSIPALKNMLGSNLGRDNAVLDIAGVSDGFKIVDSKRNKTSYFTTIDGVFVYSSSLDLLNKVLVTHEGTQRSLNQDKSFLLVQKTTGSKAHARIYLQYDEIKDIAESLFSSDNRPAISWFGDFADWSEVDVMIKNNEVILSGFTVADSNEKHINAFRNQSPVAIKAINILPYNTNTFIWLGLSDFSDYFYNNNSVSTAKMISANIKFDIDKLISLFGDEVIYASNSETIDGIVNGSWVAVKVLNTDKAVSTFKLISKYNGNTKTTKYEGYTIGRFNKPNFVSQVFGNSFSTITNNYYTFVGDYLVFANSESSLINLIGNFETGKTLDLNDNFKDFSDNISTKSNVLIYLKPENLINILSQYFNLNTSRDLQNNDKVISSFQGLSFQLSADDSYYFTNIYTNHSDVHHEENLALWKTQIDDEIVWGPYIVSDHKTKNRNIIVFDKKDNMYLIDSEGSIMWKIKIDDTPMSDVFEVDYYKNRKFQYLFNTGSYIYLVDRNGNKLTGYPKKLHSKATNGIVVFDYNKNKDYRLLVAQSDKKVYNYSIKGREIAGWALPRTSNIVIDPVVRLLANKKDYIIITDIENEIKIVDRKGKRRIKISGDLNKAKNSDYYVNRTNSKGIIITTDESGKLVYISSSGKLNYTDFGKFSPYHFFLYEDFNGDKSKDFIYIDGNKLSVFDRFKKVLFSYTFDSDVTLKPSFFKLGSKQNVLGVVLDKERTIYLFDKKGNIIISEGLVGESTFTVGKLKDDSKINLVSAAGSILYNYRLR